VFGYLAILGVNNHLCQYYQNPMFNKILGNKILGEITYRLIIQNAKFIETKQATNKEQ
jgi:hypothetical protein